MGQIRTSPDDSVCLLYLDKPYNPFRGELYRSRRTVCDDKSIPTAEMPHSGSLQIRGGTTAQEMASGKFYIDYFQLVLSASLFLLKNLIYKS